MDDLNINNLNESKNEWSIRLVNILTYHINEGFRSIFNESWKLCKQNNEQEKYLMTFQNMLSQVPLWNPNIIKSERTRIINNSKCNYLEDLITCVHIIQLKILTCIRLSKKTKKIEINIPLVDQFIHNVYINVARKLYSNVFLFERNIAPLSIQKNNREFELIIQECILNCIRENIPVDEILKCYLEEHEDYIEDESEHFEELNKKKRETKKEILKELNREENNEEKEDKKFKTIIDKSKEQNENTNDSSLEEMPIEEEISEILKNENKNNMEFKLKPDLLNLSQGGESKVPEKKSISFGETVRAVDSLGEIEEIPMTIMDEKQSDREKDLFMNNDDDDDEKLTIFSNNNDNIKLDFEVL